MLSLEDSSIEFVLTRHERGAAFMAEIYGRLTGNPAVCMGTLGPGATNLIAVGCREKLVTQFHPV